MSRQPEPPLGSELTDQPRNNSFKTLKTSEYESKIYELSNQVRLLREKLMDIEQQKASSIPPEPDFERQISSLREQNQELRKENQQLREKIRQLQSRKKHGGYDENGEKAELASVKSLRELRNRPLKTGKSDMEGLYTNKNSVRLSSGTSVTANLMRELLVECNEPSESEPMSKGQRKVQKDQFYQYKDTEDCFEPFFSNLPKEQRIRLKRSLIKQKELLFVDSNVEFGAISPYRSSPQDPPHFTRLLLVLTNIGPAPLSKVSLEYTYDNDLSITRRCLLKSRQANSSKYRTSYGCQLLGNEQLKEELDIVVNSIDFKCVKLTLTYQASREKYSQLLLLPISKIKLCRQLPFAATPNSYSRVQRVFPYQRKILSDMAKLKSIFSQAYESKDKNSIIHYNVRLTFLGKTFWLELSPVEDKLLVAVQFEKERALAQKLVGEFVFLFQKL